MWGEAAAVTPGFVPFAERFAPESRFGYLYPMSTFADIQEHWQQALRPLYPSREINNLFRFVLEDVFLLSTAQQLLVRDHDVSQSTADQLEVILERLLTGEPLQYITGFTYFDDLKIEVSPAVLIPRPETEELVFWIAASIPGGFSGTIVDWCTGSGCIALALKKRFSQATVSGLDWSETALHVAARNASALELDVLFEQQDALSDTYDTIPVDIIVSNPPYIPENEQAEMRTNVTAFEPHMALFVPSDKALLFYSAITEKAMRQLPAGGLLFFELHEDYAHETQQLVEATGAFSSVEIREDLSGKNRMLKAVRL